MTNRFNVNKKIDGERECVGVCMCVRDSACMQERVSGCESECACVQERKNERK